MQLVERGHAVEHTALHTVRPIKQGQLVGGTWGIAHDLRQPVLDSTEQIVPVADRHVGRGIGRGIDQDMGYRQIGQHRQLRIIKNFSHVGARQRHIHNRGAHHRQKSLQAVPEVFEMQHHPGTF